MSGRLQLILGLSACILNCCLLSSEAANRLGSPLGESTSKREDESEKALNNDGEGGATGRLSDVPKPETEFEAYLRQLERGFLMRSPENAQKEEDEGRGPMAVSLWTMTPEELAELKKQREEAMAQFQTVHGRMRDLVLEIVQRERQRLEDLLASLMEKQGQNQEKEQQQGGDGSTEQLKTTMDKLSSMELIERTLTGKSE